MKRETIESITVIALALLMGIFYGAVAFVVFAYSNAALAAAVVLVMVTIGILLVLSD